MCVEAKAIPKERTLKMLREKLKAVRKQYIAIRDNQKISGEGADDRTLKPLYKVICGSQ